MIVSKVSGRKYHSACLTDRSLTKFNADLHQMLGTLSPATLIHQIVNDLGVLFSFYPCYTAPMREDHHPETLLVQPLSAYRGWRLEVGCQHCGSSAKLPISDLDDRYKPGTTLRDVVERLSCRRCRGLPSSIELRHHIASRWIVKRG